MDVVYEPTVYLVGRPSVTEDFYRFLGEHQRVSYKRSGDGHTVKADSDVEWILDECRDAEVLCMSAGKICYDAFGRGRSNPKEYMANLLSMGHESVLEHAQWNFVITGVSRTFSHEHVRHRIGVAVSQRSQRYVNEADCRFIDQPLIDHNPYAQQIWEDAIENARKAYSSIVDLLMKDLESTVGDKTERLKLVRSAARSVMPNAAETIIFWSANARTLRHYLTLRGNPHAEMEIRRVARQIYEIMNKEAPSLFQDFHPEGDWDVVKGDKEC